MKIAIISCTKNKMDYVCKARLMYSKSVLFSKVVNKVTLEKLDWYIISAKHGLLSPEDIIETYDETLYTMSSEKVKEWSANVFNQIITLGVDEIDFYAGNKYRKYLVPMLEDKGIKCNVPLNGLGIGMQLRKLGKY